jgi:hypothetical protein
MDKSMAKKNKSAEQLLDELIVGLNGVLKAVGNEKITPDWTMISIQLDAARSTLRQYGDSTVQTQAAMETDRFPTAAACTNAVEELTKAIDATKQGDRQEVATLLSAAITSIS